MLLAGPPKTVREEELMNALHDADQRIGTLKEDNCVLQAQVVLQDLYVGMVHTELQSQEEKKSKGKSKKLNADSLPKLLDGDNFYQRVVEDNEQWKLEEAEKVQKQAVWCAAAEVKKKWEEEEEACKLCNNEAKDAWQEAAKLWEIEQDRAKEACQRPRWKKLGKLKAEPQKPKTWTKKGASQQAAADDAEDDEPIEPGRESDNNTQSGEDDDEEWSNEWLPFWGIMSDVTGVSRT